jgi:hypothetical protein
VDPRSVNSRSDGTVLGHEVQWNTGGIASGNRHLGARDLGSQVVDIASGDTPRVDR